MQGQSQAVGHWGSFDGVCERTGVRVECGEEKTSKRVVSSNSMGSIDDEMSSDEIKTTPDLPPRTQRRGQQMEVFPKAWMVEGDGRTDVGDSDRGVAAMEHEFVRE